MANAPLIPKIPPLRTDIQEPQQSSAVNRPPAQGASANQTSAPSNGGSPQHRTSKEWYYYWSAVGKQVIQNTQTLSGLVTYGPHASRPDPSTMPDGAIAVESDRGAIYQNEIIQGVPTWHYLAGTMWGSLSPDTRPTDLGVPDAGFTFRGTDEPYEYIWSGGAWVQAPSIDYLVNSTLVGTRQALNLIAGANVTVSGLDNGAASRVDVTIASTGGGTGGAVSSVFGRTGAVVASTGDYTAAQVTNAVSTTATYADPGWITALSWSKITGAPAAVTSVFGRTGTVVAASGDYTAAQVTNAVSSAGTYADPAWLTALSWSKLTGVPANVGLWQSGSAGAIYYNGGPVGIGSAAPAALCDVVGTIRSTGVSTISSGAGVEVLFTGGNGYVLAYDRAAGAYHQLAIGGAPVIVDGHSSPVVLNPSGGNVGIGNSSPSYLLTLNADSAAKPSTNTWTIASDIRTKRNVHRFEGDIDIIRRLDPIAAEYNGLGGTPEGQRVVSFDAAKLREIVPQCVSAAKGKLRENDAEETDLLGVNTHELFFHLLRAVQQIDQRLAALEKKADGKS